jgi:hypothetical protein
MRYGYFASGLATCLSMERGEMPRTEGDGTSRGGVVRPSATEARRGWNFRPADLLVHPTDPAGAHPQLATLLTRLLTGRPETRRDRRNGTGADRLLTCTATLERASAEGPGRPFPSS